MTPHRFPVPPVAASPTAAATPSPAPNAARALLLRLPALALVAGSALASSGARGAVQDCEIGGEPVRPASPSTLAGKSGTMRCRDRDSDQLLQEQEVQDGRIVGLNRLYANGRLVREQSFNAQGNLQGRLREFDAAGQLVREAGYSNGNRVGLARSFHPGSQQLQRVSFHAAPGGELAMAEFTPAGQLRALRCGSKPLLAPVFDDARPCGFAGSGPGPVVPLHADNGNLRARVTYAAGRLLRQDTFYDNGQLAQQQEPTPGGYVERSFASDGILRREVSWLVRPNAAPVREHEQEFAANGAPVRERRWRQGELVGEDTFYLNGQPRTRAQYSVAPGGGRWLQIRNFYDSGVLAGESSYADNGRYAPVPVGTHRQFDPHGKIKSETVYDTRGRIARERAWTPAGLLRDDEVFEDGSRKSFLRP
jgi:antitoxin component YwqK of YwqJK toxin-antitoxin module